MPFSRTPNDKYAIKIMLSSFRFTRNIEQNENLVALFISKFKSNDSFPSFGIKAKINSFHLYN